MKLESPVLVHFHIALIESLETQISKSLQGFNARDSAVSVPTSQHTTRIKNLMAWRSKTC